MKSRLFISLAIPNLPSAGRVGPGHSLTSELLFHNLDERVERHASREIPSVDEEPRGAGDAELHGSVDVLLHGGLRAPAGHACTERVHVHAGRRRYVIELVRGIIPSHRKD